MILNLIHGLAAHFSLEVLLFEKKLQGFFGTQGDTVIEKCKF